MSNLPPVTEPIPDASGRKIWTVGTLTYTFAGLIGLFALLLWGDFATSMKDRSVGQMFQQLLTEFGASNLMMSLIISSLGASISLFLAPIIAYKSDRLRGRWGRRIPYILLSTPFVSLSLAGVGFSPLLGTKLHEFLGPNAPSLNVCVLGMLTFFWVIYDFSSVIGGAVFGGLLNDVVPRAVLGRFFGFWRAISLLCGIAFNSYWEFAAKHYLETYLAIATLFGCGFMLMCLFVKEGEYPPPPPAPPHGALGFFYAARGYFRECFTIPYYWLFFATGIFAGWAAGPINMFSLPFANAVHLNTHFGHYLVITYWCSLLLAYPLGALVDRTHPLPLSLGAIVIYTLSMVVCGFFAGNPKYFGTAIVIHGVLAGTYGTLNASLSMRLLPRASFAQFGAAGGILGSITGIFIPPVIGYLLDLSHSHYSYTFFMSAGFGVIGSILYVFLYIQFIKHGGYKNYIAPDRPPA